MEILLPIKALNNNILKLNHIEVSSVDWQEILEQVNIVDYVSQYTDLIKKDGELWGKCPLHKENTPSFSVNEDEQTFYCFGCNSGGNLVSFVMEHESCTFPQAMKKIKDFYNIHDSENYSTFPDIIKILKKFKPKIKKQKDICHQELNDYCVNRYCKRDIVEWQNEGISQAVMDIFNVRYDLENEAIVFEVRNNDGTLISLKKRTLIQGYTPKYKYTHRIGSSNFLWGLYYTKTECTSKGEIIIVEGEKIGNETLDLGNKQLRCYLHLSH